VISKPAGIASQPGSSATSGEVESIADHLPALARIVAPGGAAAPAGAEPLRVVHRLDRETSGLLVLARTRAAAAALSDGLQKGALAKLYLGLSRTPPELQPPPSAAAATFEEGVCAAPVTRTEWSAAGGKEAEVSWPAETAFRACRLARSPLTIWRLLPRTGRRHQLRQHVLALQRGQGGLLGDSRYFGKAGRPAGEEAEAGLMLHSAELTIPAFTLGPQQGNDIVVRDELRKANVPAFVLADAFS